MLTGCIDIKDLLTLFDDDSIISVTFNGEENMWFCNRVKYLKAIVSEEWYDKYSLLWFNHIKVGTKFAGVKNSHITLDISFEDADITNNNEKDVDEHHDEWWTNLRLATKEEICELYSECIRSYVYNIFKKSENIIALKAIESGQCDKELNKMSKNIEFEKIMLAGITILDIKNARNNPETNEIYIELMNSIKESLDGENGKKLMDLLFA